MGKVKEPAAEYIVDKNGRKRSVTLPIDKYEKLVEDLQDLAIIAARKSEPSISLDEMKRRLKKDGLL